VKRLRKWWKAILVVVLLAMAAQGGIALFVRTARVRAFLTRHLEKSFGRPVEVQSFSASLFPSPQLDALAITVGEDPAFGHEYFLRAEKLSAGLRWMGLAQGKFELGTLQLSNPALVLARNGEGRWNLERWLPAPSGNAPPAPAGGRTVATHHLQKIEISDGHVSFKLGDDKTSFAFVQVQGSVEQTAAGRWQLDLKAEPWRSGVPLQLAGTVRIRGEVAGTSARLQPAHLEMSWEKSSLADVFRLIGGQDFGVRGLFSGEAVTESAGSDSAKKFPGARSTVAGDWFFSLKARALGVHRWDLTERQDNPRLGLQATGRWNPGAGTFSADELVMETPRSNLRGNASLQYIPQLGFSARIDSAGMQAADALDWYRAFRPSVAEDIRCQQFFTGAIAAHGWPLALSEIAFSSSGGSWTLPGFDDPVTVRPLRGGLQKGKLTVESFGVVIPHAKHAREAERAESGSALPAARNIANVALAHDFNSRSGEIRLDGQSLRVEDVFEVAAIFGRRIESGWDLRGNASADLRWQWAAGQTPMWVGHAELSQATLQVAGLNQPVELDTVRGEWRGSGRKFSFTKVAAIGANWSGTIEQPRNSGEGVEPWPDPWKFQLQADHLDAVDLDRWIGPRARPSWLQRLLPAGLGGAAAPEPSKAVFALLRGNGDLRIDELTIEKLKFRQFRAHAALDSLKLSLNNVETQWAGGEAKGTFAVNISAKPAYEIFANFDHVAMAQLPWLARVSDRVAGTVGGEVTVKVEGIGREALLRNLSGKGELQLAKVELRGWDLPATLAQGEWKAGVSRWTSGAGTFHLSDNSFELNSLHLMSSSEEFLLKGAVSFSGETDLTAESHARGRDGRTPGQVRLLQISGPIAGPRVSLAKTSVQQPGD
jgi:hypothetical protein